MRPAVIAWSGFGLLAAVLVAAVAATRPALPGTGPDVAHLQNVLLWHSLLPRAAVAILAGAALGLSGALLQRVLRNPIADPTTLGIASGAQLALTATTVLAPWLIAWSREAVAFAGGISAAAIVLALSWRRGLDPLVVVLAGMVISFVAAALGATIVLAEGDYVLSLYIWGAGALDQQNWDAVRVIAPRLLLGAAAAFLLLRPLTLLGLDDTSARSLGVALHAFRLAVIAVAVWIATTVTAEVGIIGFVGLAAPTFARAGGARTAAQTLLLSPLIGAIVLSITDSAVQLLGSGTADLAPTGAVTALFGGPLLLWLLTRIRALAAAPASMPGHSAARTAAPLPECLMLLACVVAIAAIALSLGRAPGGWTLATGEQFAELLPFRGPRIVAAGAAGGLLGAAGTLMQRLTGNPLAGPEVLGVTAGCGVGLIAALYLAPFAPLSAFVGLTLGGLLTLLAMLAVTARFGFGPERLLLAGIALSALCTAIVSTVMAQGNMQAYLLLTWMSGSTNDAGLVEAMTGVVSTLVLLPPLFLLSRWLDILPLGEPVSRGLGVNLETSRLTIAVFAALMTGIGCFLIGPLSLVGLIAPHLARLLGFVRARDQLAAASLIGCGVMILADWLSRVVFFPYQVPVGLFAVLIGGPYLVWLLGRGDAKNA